MSLEGVPWEKKHGRICFLLHGIDSGIGKRVMDDRHLYIYKHLRASIERGVGYET